MDEFDDRDNGELSDAPPAEGVRILRADEAQAAIDAGQATGRRPDRGPRFGDVPPQPSGPRPQHRFPLPDAMDPAEAVPRPPVRIDERKAEEQGGRGERGRRPSGRRSAGRANSEYREPTEQGTDEPGMTEEWWRSDEPTPDLAPPREGITLHGGSGPELPHWTDPPTGDIPRLSSGEPGEGDDLAAWQALGSRGLRWRDEASDWDDLDDMADLGGDEAPLGALDTNRTEHSDVYSFDEQFERLEEERTGSFRRPGLGRRGRGPLRRSPEPGQFHDQDAAEPEEEPLPPPPTAAWQEEELEPEPPLAPPRPPRFPAASSRRGDRDLASAFVVGIGLLVLAIVAFAVGPAAFVVLTTLVVTLCALELYNLMQQRGFRPATLVGLTATVAGMLAAYWRGEPALPLVLALVFITTVLWYMLGVVEARPVVNIALTLMAFVWVGVFGSFAALLLRAHHGSDVLLLAILATVAGDVMAYAAGRTLGSRPLAPHISPGKTWEGVIVGGIGAVIIAVIVGKGLMSTTFTIRHALLLGVTVAIVGPIGDLTESMVKRDLDLKDSGTILPGHGGLLDRFDALLFVLPATFYLAQYLNLLK